jgi:cysteine synthase A
MLKQADQSPSTFFDPGVLDRYPALAEYAAKVGRTTLLEVATEEGCGRVFAKAEWENPHGTIKDRVALAMMWSALSSGLDPEAETILEYSGGQLAVALAHLCRALGVRSEIVMSDATPESNLEAVRSCGGAVHLVPKDRGFWAVMQRAFDLKKSNPALHFLYQHTNAANLAMHAEATAEEILAQLPTGRADAWVTAIGTGGTLVGVGDRLRERFPELQIYGVTPAELPYASQSPPNGEPKFAGSGGLGSGRRQPFVERAESWITGHFHYSHLQAQTEMHRFRQQSGISIGSSAAANLLAARALSRQLGPDSVVVTVFQSAGSLEEWRAVEARFSK